MISPHPEACRGTGKDTKTSGKGNSLIGNTGVWRQAEEAKATNTRLSTPARRNAFKYINKIYDTEASILPLKQSDWTRGHQMKLKKHHNNTNTRHLFLIQRVTEWWNNLPEVIDAPSVNAFKNRFDHHFEDHQVKYNYKALDNPVSPAAHQRDFLKKPKGVYVCMYKIAENIFFQNSMMWHVYIYQVTVTWRLKLPAIQLLN